MSVRGHGSNNLTLSDVFCPVSFRHRYAVFKSSVPLWGCDTNTKLKWSKTLPGMKVFVLCRCWTLVRVSPSQMSLPRRRRRAVCGGSSCPRGPWRAPCPVRVRLRWTGWRCSCRCVTTFLKDFDDSVSATCLSCSSTSTTADRSSEMLLYYVVYF